MQFFVQCFLGVYFKDDTKIIVIYPLEKRFSRFIFLEKDLKYKGLLIDQVQVLRSFKNQEDILRRAQIVYKLKKRKSSYNYIKLATVDFELLERNCDEWNKVFIK